MTSRSATATPTGSPKRRHLPQIPPALQQHSFSRVRQVNETLLLEFSNRLNFLFASKFDLILLKLHDLT